MKDLNSSIILSLSLAAILITFTAADIEGQVKKMTAEDLTAESTAVLYGKCTKVKSEWNESRDIIFTYVTIVPEEYLKGNLGSETVLTIPGGRVDDIIYEVSDMPLFTEGEEVAAFIWTNPAGKNLVVGGYQGKMKIEKDRNTGKRMVLGESIEDGEVAAGSKTKDNYGQMKKMALEDFAVRVKGYVKN